MPSYAAPSAADIETRCGLNPDIEHLTQTALDAKITGLIPDAEGRVALEVGEARFDSSGLTTRQAKALASAVKLRTGAIYLRAVATRKLTGTQEPLLEEEAKQHEEHAQALEAEAEGYERLVASGDAPESTTVITSFTSDMVPTFSRDITW